MATIGTFSQKDGKWTGTIRTMTINVKAQMVPVTDKAEAGPDYRIFAGGAELGAAWREESKDGETPYLAVKLDDPEMAGLILSRIINGPPEENTEESEE